MCLCATSCVFAYHVTDVVELLAIASAGILLMRPWSTCIVVINSGDMCRWSGVVHLCEKGERQSARVHIVRCVGGQPLFMRLVPTCLWPQSSMV
jgi:hypothetical protein